MSESSLLKEYITVQAQALMHVSLIIRPQEATGSIPDAAAPTTTSSLDPVLTSSPNSVSSSATELDNSIPLLPPPMPKLEELTSTQNEAAVIPSSSCAVNTHAKNLMLKRRQRKEMKDLNDPSNPICVEEHQSKKKEPVMWIQELRLSPSDRDILFNSTAWLTDSIVDAAQKLLKKACPVSGLQSVSCGLTMTYDVQPGEFIQVLNTGHGHWVTISTIGTSHPTVRIYDSLYSSAGTRLKAQIAAVMATEKQNLILEFMDVAMQSGSYDCGLFAIAFATALALGEKPELFSFEQSKMRTHLRQCLEKGEMEMFPVSRKRRMKKSLVKSTEEIPVYCKCRMPELPGDHMIECTACKEWYHLDTCVFVSPSARVDKSAPWLCYRCL